MAEITAAMVKDLRERSGAGMMDCKKALTETNGDMEAAIDWLRTKGLATAAKKSGRTAAEGLLPGRPEQGGRCIFHAGPTSDGTHPGRTAGASAPLVLAALLELSLAGRAELLPGGMVAQA